MKIIWFMKYHIEDVFTWTLIIIETDAHSAITSVIYRINITYKLRTIPRTVVKNNKIINSRYII